VSAVALDVRVKRIYDPAEPGDGYRVLIDHVWPRGISRERAKLDEWARELAPSDELRRWFDHIPERFDEFRSTRAVTRPSEGSKQGSPALTDQPAEVRPGRPPTLSAS
jgi:uncharacterized protein YeaO (DUF488 family)